MDAIREWESARRSGAFSAGQRERLKNPKAEFHLEMVDGGWNLYPYHDTAELVHEHLIRQPGEPTGAAWEVTNPDAAQPMQMKIRIQGKEGAVGKIRFEVDRSVSIELPGDVRAGQSVLLESDGIVRVYDAKGSHVRSQPLGGKVPVMKSGVNQVRFDCEFEGDTPPKVGVTFKTRGSPEKVVRPSGTR